MNKTIRVLVKSLFIILMLGIFPNVVVGETVGVFVNPATAQHAFAAGDIQTALEAKSFTVEIRDLSTLADNYAGKKVVIALASNTQVASLLTAQGGSSITGLGEVAVPQILFRKILARIRQLRFLTIPARPG